MAGAFGGPLAGTRIVEFEGIGPAPYCGMLLADMGADLVRVARPSANRGPLIQNSGDEPIDRGRKFVTLDLKDPKGLAGALDLISRADAVIEGLRPGVMERLGLGPKVVLVQNPALVYGRITGWGQEGPWARTAGHDLNYIALSGALAAMGEAGRPPMPPLNLVGDYGGGGLFAAFGIVSALLHARTTGQGQVVDAAMLDGAANQMTMIYGLMSKGHWSAERGENFLDGSAPFYRCYTCADGKYLSVACIEPQFFLAFMEGVGLSAADWDQTDRATWPALAEAIATVIVARSRDDWAALFDGTDACVAPVLDMTEAAHHPHNLARQSFVGSNPVPAPAPRMSLSHIGAGAIRSVSLGEVISEWSATSR
ncbi:MAG: CaiB/BaiF CoA transferase family protein [Paracoccaceae bacterium]